MAESKVRIDQMADEIMKGLTEYADLATDETKSAVKKAGKTVKDEIKANARKRPGSMPQAGQQRPRFACNFEWRLTIHLIVMVSVFFL